MKEYAGVGLLALLNIVALAIAWGDMRRQVQSNRERQDERHTENQEVLREIRGDVKRINGQVARNIEVLGIHSKEIDRLRGDK